MRLSKLFDFLSQFRTTLSFYPAHPQHTRHDTGHDHSDTRAVWSLCLELVVPSSSLPPTLAGSPDPCVMQGEEESPHYVAAPGTNDSGGPKRTSSRDWGQHWLDLDRDYFRPVSATDIENLRSQVRLLGGRREMGLRKCACVNLWMGPDRLPPLRSPSQLRSVEQMMIEAEASSLFRPLGIASFRVEGQSASTKLQQQQQRQQQQQQQQQQQEQEQEQEEEEVTREEELGLLPMSQEEAEEDDASSVRLQPTIRPQPQCPPSDSSASTSSCSISDKENKAKR